MCQLLLAHTNACIFDGELNVIVTLGSTDADIAPLLCELTGIVGKCVQHKQREHLIGFHLGRSGFHLQVDAFHAEAATSHRYNVEERLQGEGLNVQTQFTLAQLNPVGKHLRLLIDIVGEL